MAFRNSLLLIAFFLVATTSVANCTLLPPGLPGVPNLLSTIIIARANLINITAGVGVRTPLAGANVRLICNGVPIGPTTVVPSNGNLVINIPFPNAALVNPSCILSANVTIGGVTSTVTSTLSSLVGQVPSVVSLLTNLLLGALSAVVVNGTLVTVTV